MLFTAFLLTLVCMSFAGFFLSAKTALLFVIILLSCLIVHLVCGSTQSVHHYRQLGAKYVWKLPFLFLVFHFVYGWGMLYGLFKRK